MVDGSHEWALEGSGDCGSVAIEESRVFAFRAVLACNIQAYNTQIRRRTIYLNQYIISLFPLLPDTPALSVQVPENVNNK